MAAGPTPPTGLESVFDFTVFVFETPKECPHLILGSGLGDRRAEFCRRILSPMEQLKGSITRRQSLEPCAKDLDQCLGKRWTHFPSCAGLLESYLGAALA